MTRSLSKSSRKLVFQRWPRSHAGLLAFGVRDKAGDRCFHAHEPDAILLKVVDVAAAQLGTCIAQAHAAFLMHAINVAKGQSGRTHEEMIHGAFTPIQDLRLADVWSTDEWSVVKIPDELNQHIGEAHIHIEHVLCFQASVRLGETYNELITRYVPRGIRQLSYMLHAEPGDGKSVGSQKVTHANIFLRFQCTGRYLQNGMKAQTWPHETVADLQFRTAEKLGWHESEMRLWVDDRLPASMSRMWAFIEQKIFVEKTTHSQKAWCESLLRDRMCKI